MIQRRISVVDDDESIRRTTGLLIESFGYRVAIFESAETLLKPGQLNEMCCLIVDIRTLGMNALQLQRHLTTEGWSIIFITAYGNEELRRQAKPASAIAFSTSRSATSSCSKLFVQRLHQDKGEKATSDYSV